jgi:hypothetical protein
MTDIEKAVLAFPLAFISLFVGAFIFAWIRDGEPPGGGGDGGDAGFG